MVPALSENATFTLTATTAEDGSGTVATAIAIQDPVLPVESFGVDDDSGVFF